MEVVTSGRMEEFYRDLADKNMDALWRGRPPARANRDREASYPPCYWSWAHIRPFLDQAGKLVATGPEAERRVVQLIHPALKDLRSASHTLTANIQMVLPGEVAPTHRHTTAAIRFIIEGEAAVTIVEGEPVEMRPGDLVLTPGNCWHGHINESDGPVLWMDTLDRPIVSALRQVFQESYGSNLEPVTRPKGYSQARFGAGALRPIGSPSEPISPLFVYPWADTEHALRQLGTVDADPFDDIAFDYVNPTTGGAVLPTIGCRIQMIRPGTRTRAHRHSYVSVHHAFRGSATSVIDGVRIDWSEGDFFVIPPFAWHEHFNERDADAILFSTTDIPVLESLHLLREDVFNEGDGHQPIIGTYAEVLGSAGATQSPS